MNADNRNLVIWLSCVCVVIYLMIVVGGVTRLTQSGLSMVDWKPIMGVIPPLTLTEWEQAFEAYQQYPEFQKINRDMDLEQFKGIFYWEFGHRLLGRVIGLVYFIPFFDFSSAWTDRKKMETPALDRICARGAARAHGLVHGKKRLSGCSSRQSFSIGRSSFAGDPDPGVSVLVNPGPVGREAHPGFRQGAESFSLYTAIAGTPTPAGRVYCGFGCRTWF